METSAQTFARLVTALDEVLVQEDSFLKMADYAAVLEAQRRAAPLVEGLARLEPEIADKAARARVSALVTRRAHVQELLASRISEVRCNLGRIREDEQRLMRVGPAYGRGPAVSPPSQLSAKG